MKLQAKINLELEPTVDILLLLGFKKFNDNFDYLLPPFPADGSTYRLEYSATHFKGGEAVVGTEEWRAYVVNKDKPTIRRFKTLGEIVDFHKGMCGGDL